MTEQQLAEIAARAKAASPGPWVVAQVGEGDEQWWIETQFGGGFPICGFDLSMGATETEGADGAFIAAAREDVPALLEEVRWLWALRDVPCGRCGQQLGEHVPGVHLPGPAAGVECPTGAARGEAARERRYSTE